MTSAIALKRMRKRLANDLLERLHITACDVIRTHFDKRPETEGAVMDTLHIDERAETDGALMERTVTHIDKRPETECIVMDAPQPLAMMDSSAKLNSFCQPILGVYPIPCQLLP